VDQILVAPPIFDCPNLDACYVLYIMLYMHDLYIINDVNYQLCCIFLHVLLHLCL
ncbi:hypothetical protein S83_063212, partial [Arachis hypogaea]